MPETRKRNGTPGDDSPVACAASLLGAAFVVFQLFHQGASPEATLPMLAPWDKVAHFLVYCAITALLWFGTGGRMPIAVVTIAVAIGTFDELHQGTLPGRIADGWDFLTGLCAAALTVFSLLLLFGASAARRNASITP